MSLCCVVFEFKVCKFVLGVIWYLNTLLSDFEMEKSPVKMTKKQTLRPRKRAKHANEKPFKKIKMGRLICRCSPTYLYKLVSELDNHISSEQLAAVMRTPFHQYWKIPDIPVSSRFIIAVLKQCDSNNTSLNIASKALFFTAEDLSVVLGIKAHGRQVQLRGLKTKSKTLRDLSSHQQLMQIVIR